MSIINIGCCGAYCKTCPVFRENKCKGCRLGYLSGKRSIEKAKCKMKVCCIKKGLNTCADCDIYLSCELLQGFYNKHGYKYKKYKEATVFIRENGYDQFLEIANEWQRQYGKYK